MTGPGGGRRGADPLAQVRSLVAATVAGQLRLASRLSGLVWEPVLEGLAAAARPPGATAPAAPRPAAPRPGVVRLDAQRGVTLAVPFAVENRYDHDVDVTFAADPLVAAAGAAGPADAVSFDPAAATLRPGDRLVVRALVQVTDRFDVDVVYSTALRVHNMPAAPVPVEIVVRPGLR